MTTMNKQAFEKRLAELKTQAKAAGIDLNPSQPTDGSISLGGKLRLMPSAVKAAKAQGLTFGGRIK